MPRTTYSVIATLPIPHVNIGWIHPFLEILEGLRHDLAVYLMRDPDRTASAISRELGYRDPAIFTRAFRRWTGRTPTQYRNAVSS